MYIYKLISLVLLLAIMGAGFTIYKNHTSRETFDPSVLPEIPTRADESEGNIILYVNFNHDVSDFDIEKLEAYVRTFEEVLVVTKYTASEALYAYRDSRRNDTEALKKMENMESNPFNARLEVVVERGNENAVKEKINDNDTASIIESVTLILEEKLI